MIRGAWCNDRLKIAAINSIDTDESSIHYVGIAADEPKRLARLEGTNLKSPLSAIGWTETQCFKICNENDLLSPIYSSSERGGCWFCHNQSIDQLRKLRKSYPDLWGLLMKWDIDSPVPFNPRGHSIHDFDLRFSLEEKQLIPSGKNFRWNMLQKYMEEI